MFIQSLFKEKNDNNNVIFPKLNKKKMIHWCVNEDLGRSKSMLQVPFVQFYHDLMFCFSLTDYMTLVRPCILRKL